MYSPLCVNNVLYDPRWQHRSGGQVQNLDYTGSKLMYSPWCVNNVLYYPRWQHLSSGQVWYLD